MSKVNSKFDWYHFIFYRLIPIIVIIFLILSMIFFNQITSILKHFIVV